MPADSSELIPAETSASMPADTSEPMSDDPDKVRRVQEKALQMASTISSTWEMLRRIVQTHENTIQKRWTKRTKRQRERILVQAWPRINELHRPEYQAIVRCIAADHPINAELDDAPYLWPHINLEELRERRPLLLFLNSRGHHPPETFFGIDFFIASVGISYVLKDFEEEDYSGHPHSDELQGHSMVIKASHTESYGKVIPDSADDTLRTVHTHLGLLTLKIQCHNLKFLVRCTEIILHDLQPFDFDCTHLLAETSLLSSLDNQSEYGGRGSIEMEAPYRLPAGDDFDHIVRMISAKRAAAEDHLWMLREDPQYFYDFVREHKEHYPALDSEGKAIPWKDECFNWDFLVPSILMEAYTYFICWSMIYQHTEGIQQMIQRNHLNDPRPSISEEIYVSIQVLQKILTELAKKYRVELMRTLPYSPPLGAIMTTDLDNDFIFCATRQQDPLVDILLDLAGQFDPSASPASRVRETWEFPYTIDILGGMLKREPTLMNRLSTALRQVIGDLGVAAVANQSCYYYCAAFYMGEGDPTPKVKSEYREWEAKYREIANPVYVLFELRYTKAMMPFHKFRHSLGKRTKNGIEKARQAEQQLDLLWSHVDEGMKSLTGASLFEIISPWLRQTRDLSDLQRTPEWIEPKKPIRDSPSRTEQHSELTPIFDHLAISENARLNLPSPPTPKVKTRAPEMPVCAAAEPLNQPPELPETPNLRKFKLKPGPHKVFKALFFVQKTTDQPGAIPWMDFLNAMNAMGFSVEKLRGSIWQFTPTDASEVGADFRGIHFHQPHSGAKIPFNDARRMGRRLTRAYGWTGEMFELE